MSDFMTLLECNEPWAILTKKYRKDKDGLISCKPFNACKLYKAYDAKVSGLDDIESVMHKLKCYVRFCIIRGALASSELPPYYRRYRRPPIDFKPTKTIIKYLIFAHGSKKNQIKISSGNG